MEVVGSCRAVDNLDVYLLQNVSVLIVQIAFVWNYVILIAELQVSLWPAGRVLWALSIVAVREEHHDSALHIPLGFLGGDELVNDYLGTVGEVAELSLPQNKCIWVSHRVPELIPEDCELREVGVGSEEVLLHSVREDVFDWTVEAFPVLENNFSVSVREGSSFNILP